MKHRQFEMFCGLIDSLPPEAVLKVAAKKLLKLEDDLAQGRTLPGEDTDSILNFCRFLESATQGLLFLPDAMPLAHWTFYERTVERLVAAGELPHKAKEDFEAANNAAFFRIMA